MAKALSPKQKKIAAMGGNPNKIDAEDFKALRKGKGSSKSSDEAQDAKVMKNMTPAQMLEFKRKDKKMDKKKPSRAEDKKMDKDLANSIKAKGKKKK